MLFLAFNSQSVEAKFNLLVCGSQLAKNTRDCTNKNVKIKYAYFVITDFIIENNNSGCLLTKYEIFSNGISCYF
jgi:hypothetical protein